MANPDDPCTLDGTWDVVTKTPMGDQKALMTIVTDGGTFSGKLENSMAILTLENGRVEGTTLTWTMELTAPMKMTLNGTATISGDTLTGKVKAGIFGSSAMTGTRVA